MSLRQIDNGQVSILVK